VRVLEAPSARWLLRVALASTLCAALPVNAHGDVRPSSSVVTNVGTTATTSPITVSDPLPAGLTYVSGAGAGWSLSTGGQTVTVTNPGPVAKGDILVFALAVNAGPAIVASVTNTGTIDATGPVTVSDPLSAGLTYVSGAGRVYVAYVAGPDR
jgi:hypothetical protein